MLNDEKFTGYKVEKIKALLAQLQDVQERFKQQFEVSDIFTNSKIYEILMADSHDHILIEGHTGSRDAKEDEGKLIEYKHYKESSSNHTWTFNDYTDNTLNALAVDNISVIFGHIDDNESLPKYDWYYEVKGSIVSSYISRKAPILVNERNMINISPKQLEELGATRKASPSHQGKYHRILGEIFSIISHIEENTTTRNLLTSNKLWELVLALELNHQINSNQGGILGKYDSSDGSKTFEYKVSGRSKSWGFNDITENVLNAYLENDEIILAIVDKKTISLSEAYAADPKEVVQLLRKKLIQRVEVRRRLKETISLKEINARRIF